MLQKSFKEPDSDEDGWSDSSSSDEEMPNDPSSSESDQDSSPSARSKVSNCLSFSKFESVHVACDESAIYHACERLPFPNMRTGSSMDKCCFTTPAGNGWDMLTIFQ